MPDLTMTSDEEKRFQQALLAAGMDVGAAIARNVNVPAGTTCELPDQAALFGMVTRQVDTLDALNTAIGASEDVFQRQPSRDRAMDYSVPVAKSHLPDLRGLSSRAERALTLGPFELEALARATGKYLFGDSRKVSAEAVQLIEAVQFPAAVNLIGAMNVTLGDNAVLLLKSAASGYSPYVVVLGSLEIGKGAQIEIRADASFNVQVFHSSN